jgi:hypothetical protein
LAWNRTKDLLLFSYYSAKWPLDIGKYVSCLSVLMFIFYAYPPVCSTICLSICPSISLSVFESAYKIVHFITSNLSYFILTFLDRSYFISYQLCLTPIQHTKTNILSVCPTVRLSIHLSVQLFVFPLPSVCLSIWLSVCLSISSHQTSDIFY